jgi:hypothetical protein
MEYRDIDAMKAIDNGHAGESDFLQDDQSGEKEMS